MKLSEIEINNLNIYRDGEFKLLAQCVIKTHRKILSFLSEDKYIDEVLDNSNISCIVCKRKHVKLFIDKSLGVIISDNPKLTFFKIHNILFTRYDITDTLIDSNTTISKSAVISKYNVKIGKNVIIEDNVVINNNVVIGDNTIIRSGCVIGGQGFEFKRNIDIGILRVSHHGKTIVGNHVEIKEYVSIHQAVFDWDKTIIDDYCKIDAHAHVGHASKIGKRVMMGSHSNISGNVEVGQDVYIGPGVTISNRIKIGDNSKVSIGSVVTKNVGNNLTVTGNFAIPHEYFISDLKSKIKK